jgi:hypothetical protein
LALKSGGGEDVDDLALGKCEVRRTKDERDPPELHHSYFILLPFHAVHQVAGDAVFLQHHGDGLRGVEGRVPLAAALGVADERLLELIGEAGEVRMQKCELRSSVSSTFEIPHSSLSRP